MRITVLLIVLLAACGCLKMSEVYEVIVIGAGLAGLSASKKLSEKGVNHLILQSRDRLGGRIQNAEFQDLKIDLGASFIHTKSKELEDTIFEGLDWETESIDQSQTYIHQYYGKLDKETEEKVYDIHDKLIERIAHNAYSQKQDISAKDAGKKYFEEVVNHMPAKIRDSVKWLIELKANNDGADFSELSAREMNCQNNQKQFYPKGGYSSMIRALDRQSKGAIHLLERVLSIDYTDKDVKIFTSKGKTYLAKRVISSLPLGVLKHNSTKFVPPLPKQYSQLIEKIGIGNQNKLFVSFNAPFWGDKGGWLNFVTKNTKTNKYPVAYVLDNDADKYVLCFFLAGKGGRQIQQMKDEDIAKDIAFEMNKFFCGKKIEVLKVRLTRWDADENCLGSYSFYKVGTTQEDIIEIRQPIDNKIWFVGEHTHPSLFSMTQGAYQTGEWAAEEVMESLGYKWKEGEQQQDSSDSENDSEGKEDQ